MKTTRVNITLEWERAPAEGRFAFDHARVIGGWIIVGWGTLSGRDHRFTYSSAGKMCRMCFGLEAEGDADNIAAVVRVVDTERPFAFPIRDVLQQPQEELRLPDAGVKIVAEIDRFAML